MVALQTVRVGSRHAAAPTMKEGQRALCSRRGNAREELGAPGAPANRSRGEGQGVEIPGGPSHRQTSVTVATPTTWRRPQMTPPEVLTTVALQTVP